jgi:hypothetical protein
MGWLYDQNQHPTHDPGPGYYWSWNGSQWEPRPVPHAPTPPTPPTNLHTDPLDPVLPPSPTDQFFGSYQPPPRTPLAALNYPTLNLPRWEAPPAFTHPDFRAPTQAEAEAEPGFDYALKQGIKAYENSKAYTGTYRGGATIKGINDYARNMANQNYGQVFERAGQTYDRNRGNAAQNYMTNYGVSRDVFDRNYGAAKDEYAPRARAAELQYGRDWDMFAYEGDDAYRRWKALIDANSY